MSDVTSVKITKDSSMVGCLIVMLIGGGLLLGLFSLVNEANNSQYCFAGLMFFAAEIVVSLLAQPNYILQIKNRAGKANVLESMDEDYLRRIVDAINEAIDVRLDRG